MRIKVGFVTNSSSTTYIIVDTNENPLDIENEVLEWNMEVDPSEVDLVEIRCCETFKPDQIQKLKEWNNYGKKPDWVQEIMGVPYNQFGSKKLYSASLAAVRNGHTVHFVITDNTVRLDDFVSATDNLKLLYCSEWWYDDDKWGPYE